MKLGFIGFYWVLIDWNCVLLGFDRFWWNETGIYWVLLGFTGFYWVLLGFTRFYWVLLGFTGFYWVLPWLRWSVKVETFIVVRGIAWSAACDRTDLFRVGKAKKNKKQNKRKTKTKCRNRTQFLHPIVLWFLSNRSNDSNVQRWCQPQKETKKNSVKLGTRVETNDQPSLSGKPATVTDR